MVHVVGVLQRDHDGRRAGVEVQLEGRLAGIGEEPLPECVVDPGSRDQSRPVGGRARDEPVDPPAKLLVRDDALLDQERLQRSDACSCRWLTGGRDRVVRVVVTS